MSGSMMCAKRLAKTGLSLCFCLALCACAGKGSTSLVKTRLETPALIELPQEMRDAARAEMRKLPASHPLKQWGRAATIDAARYRGLWAETKRQE